MESTLECPGLEAPHLSSICNEQGWRRAGHSMVPGIHEVPHGPGALRGLETCIAGWGMYETPSPMGPSVYGESKTRNKSSKAHRHPFGWGAPQGGWLLPRETWRSRRGGWAIFTVTRGEVDPAEIKMEVAEAVTGGAVRTFGGYNWQPGSEWTW